MKVSSIPRPQVSGLWERTNEKSFPTHWTTPMDKKDSTMTSRAHLCPQYLRPKCTLVPFPALKVHVLTFPSFGLSLDLFRLFGWCVHNDSTQGRCRNVHWIIRISKMQSFLCQCHTLVKTITRWTWWYNRPLQMTMPWMSGWEVIVLVILATGTVTYWVQTLRAKGSG